MFTIEQIKTAHSKVKSGADFPAYIKELREIGVKSYEHFVSDGHIRYYGTGDFTISVEAKWTLVEIANTRSAEKLRNVLSVHQQGQTSYTAFCLQSAEAGVNKWEVNIEKRICTYYDKDNREMLVEAIPQA